MTFDETLNRMIALKPYEQTGKAYFEKYGTYLSFPQFLFLCYYPERKFTPEHLHAIENSKKIQEIYFQFRSISSDQLSAERFIMKERDIEVEQLPRYADIPAHSHDFYECVYVFNGYCDHLVGSQPYRHQLGTFSIIPPGTEHRLIPSEDCICMTIKIRTSAFRNMDLPNLEHFVYPISFQAPEDMFIFSTLMTLYNQQLQGLLYSEKMMRLLLHSTLIHFCQNHWDSLQHLAPHTQNSQQMFEITNYIIENYQTVTLSSLAKHFSYNPSYLSTMIKQQKGISFAAILRDIRMKHAIRLLTQTNYPLDYICKEVGYQGVPQFITSFRKEYGMSPIKFRKEHSIQTL